MADQDESVGMERVRVIRPQRVVERRRRLVEGHAVLLEIRRRLSGVPRESHANIVLHLSEPLGQPGDDDFDGLVDARFSSVADVATAAGLVRYAIRTRLVPG